MSEIIHTQIKSVVPDSNKEKKSKKNIQTTCLELDNIKYKTMLEHGAKSEMVPKAKSNNAKDIENYLEQEKNQRKHLTWSRLDRTSKIKKLHEYAENYCNEKKLTVKELQELKTYFTRSINRKKLLRVKEVTYDKEKECITDVPNLIFNKARKFTLKRSAQRSSTLSSLGPGNTRKKRSSKKKDKDKIEGNIKA
jgi:hypothetical protein